MKRFTNEDWKVGTRVKVTAGPHDDFGNDFIGTITGYHEPYIIVEDQDGDGWCVEAAQLEEAENADDVAEQLRRDEKRGLYVEYIDPTN